MAKLTDAEFVKTFVRDCRTPAEEARLRSIAAKLERPEVEGTLVDAGGGAYYAEIHCAHNVIAGRFGIDPLTRLEGTKVTITPASPEESR
jgi:hypothetical protein